MHPGVAKFGIALEWGSRGLEFESRHSDQKVGNYFRSFPFFISVERFEAFNAAVRWTVACRRSRRRQHLSVPNLDIRTMGKSL